MLDQLQCMQLLNHVHRMCDFEISLQHILRKFLPSWILGQCASSKYLSNTDCASSCPAGYYGRGTRVAGRTYEACETDCNACSSATTCTECASSKYLSNTDRVSPCPTGYYSSGTGVTDRTCEACETNCNECGSSATSTECASSKYLSSNCVSSCPAGY